jgi:hypothetical protein
MNGTLSSDLPRVLARAPLALVGKRARGTLLQLAKSIPDVWSSFGFECRLGREAEVDLGLSVVPDGLASLLSPGTGVGAPTIRAVVPGGLQWKRLVGFSRVWSEPRTQQLRSWLPFLFLEFDAGSASQSPPVPSVFLALDSPLDRAAGRPHFEAASIAAELLRGRRLSSRDDVKLRHCFDALPGGGHVLHLGLMLGRSQAQLRLSVRLPYDTVTRYLGAIGADAAAEGAREVLAVMARWLSPVQLDFDFAPSTSPRIGFGIRPDPATGERWEALLDDLVAMRCCRREKAEALLEWTNESEPERFLLSHVKVVTSPGARPQAKAYVETISREHSNKRARVPSGR